jgi:RNA polymerase sigma-70 factor (ECF subfamily)
VDDATGRSGAEEEQPDRRLVERTLAGDTDAFAVLHRRYYGRIYRLALFRMRSVPEAEDIAAETFVRAIGHLAGYRFQGESVYPWLARIASNLIADQGRRNAGATVVSLEGSSEGVRAFLEGLSSSAPDPHTLAERQETQALLRSAIASLPGDQADAVLLRFGGDMPLKEIALAMGKTEGAIKSLLHRGLVNLRRTLIDEEQAARQFGQWRARANQTAVEESVDTRQRRQQTASPYGDYGGKDRGTRLE